MIVDCIDMRSLGSYKFVHELTRKPATAKTDPWDLLMLCETGNICCYGGEELMVSTHHQRTTTAILAAAPTAIVTQDGDDGQNIKFHVSDFPAVASVVKPLRKRKLNAEAATKFVAVGTATRFRN